MYVKYHTTQNTIENIVTSMIAQTLPLSFLVNGSLLTTSSLTSELTLTSSTLNGFLPTSPNEAFPPIINHIVSKNKSNPQIRNVPPNPIVE